MDTINTLISENLKHLREQRKQSLDAVARLSGVSKSMLGQIERGEVNPTVSTVWKIANGLKVPFSQLLSRPESACEVVPLSAVQPVLSDGGRYRDYPVFPFDADRRFEMLYIELDPGSHLEAEPHPAGAQEFITVFSGELEVRAGGETLLARDRDSLRFQADCAHRYRNVSRTLCRLSMVISYPA